MRAGRDAETPEVQSNIPTAQSKMPTAQSKMPALILASASPRRAELLRQVGAAFEIRAAGVDETAADGLPPGDYVEWLAYKKASAVAGLCADAGPPGFGGRGPGALVIGADTVVVAPGGELLGKPAGAEDARRMLRLLSGAWHEVYTGVCVLDAHVDTGVCILDAHVRGAGRESDGAPPAGLPPAGLPPAGLARHERTRVKIRPLDERVITRYIATGEPSDKAGAYAIQGRGSLLVERIEGCYYNVMGLPLGLLDGMLAARGYALL